MSQTNGTNGNQAQPVKGAFPGMPLRLPAGQPPPFNHGIWSLEADGSFSQIIASYKGSPLRGDRVCSNQNCRINRTQCWRKADDRWYCQLCYYHLKKYNGTLQVPPPDSHIFRHVGRRTKPKNRARDRVARSVARARAPTNLNTHLPAPAVVAAPVNPPAMPQVHVSLWQGFTDSNLTGPPQQQHASGFPQLSSFQPQDSIDPSLYQPTTNAAPPQQAFLSSFGDNNQAHDGSVSSMLAPTLSLTYSEPYQQASPFLDTLQPEPPIDPALLTYDQAEESQRRNALLEAQDQDVQARYSEFQLRLQELQEDSRDG